VATLDRVKTLDDLRRGVYDVLVGVNLLREGLDLPEVSLVAILDADKEGFLRSHRSLTQTAGRAARNVNGRVIMYADTITQSMQLTIDETNSRRSKALLQRKSSRRCRRADYATRRCRQTYASCSARCPAWTMWSLPTPSSAA